MNQIDATISLVSTSDAVASIDMQAKGLTFTAVLIDAPEQHQWLQVNQEVTMLFKETEVAIGIAPLGLISLRNQLPCTITEIIEGKILSTLTLNFDGTELQSVITRRSLNRLGLHVNKEVIALIKANEISLQRKH